MNKEGWKVKKLGEVFDLYQPKTISAKEMIEDGEYPVFGANGIIGKYDQYNHEYSELLMTCRGATCGTLNISLPFSWINGNAMVIHPKNTDSLIFKFIYYQLLGADLSSVITGAAQPQITRQSLEILQFFIPPLPIQNQIVAELDELNNILDKKRKQLEELDTLAQATFYEMFGDPVENEKGWEVKTMEKVCKQIFGGGTPSKSNNSYYDKGNILWVTPKDMKYKFITDSLIKITESGLENSSAKLAPKGAVLMVLRSGILKHTLPVAIAQTELTVNQDLKVFICSSSISNIYLYSCLKAYESYLLTNVRAVTADNIEFSIIKNLNIPLPPLALQNQFAKRVEAIEKQKELINKSIVDVQLLFDYMMDKYFN